MVRLVVVAAVPGNVVVAPAVVAPGRVVVPAVWPLIGAVFGALIVVPEVAGAATPGWPCAPAVGGVTETFWPGIVLTLWPWAAVPAVGVRVAVAAVPVAPIRAPPLAPTVAVPPPAVPPAPPPPAF